MCQVKNFYLWLLQFIGILALLVVCLWLILRPKSPTVSIVEFSVPPIDNNQSLDSGSQDILSYTLEIENPNSDSGIYYDDSTLSFSYDQDTLATETIPSFEQGKGKTRDIVRRLNVDPLVWKAFRKAMSNATAELKIGFLTKFRYKTVGIKSKHHGMDIGARLRIGKHGKILYKKKKKKIRLKHMSKKGRVKASNFR